MKKKSVLVQYTGKLKIVHKFKHILKELIMKYTMYTQWRSKEEGVVEDKNSSQT